MNNLIKEQELLHVSGGQTDNGNPKVNEAKEYVLSAFYQAQSLSRRNETLEEYLRGAYRDLYVKQGFDVASARKSITSAHDIADARQKSTPPGKDREYLKGVLYYTEKALKLLEGV